MNKLLLTAFAPWRAQQPSNSSDTLLQAIQKTVPSLYFVRGLPVNLPVARSMTIAKLQQVQPQVLVLCGMAETRSKLSVEVGAVVGDRQLYTPIDVETLVAGLAVTEISHDAGRFVCNSLYYAMLSYIQTHSLACRCLFVHVPILVAHNQEPILADFQALLQRLATPVTELTA